MARSKSHKDEEDLRGKLREIEKENRALRRRLKKLEKNRHLYEQWQLDSDEQVQPEEAIQYKEITCPSCGSGVLLSMDLGIKWLFTCSTCTYRKTSLK